MVATGARSVRILNFESVLRKAQIFLAAKERRERKGDKNLEKKVSIFEFIAILCGWSDYTSWFEACLGKDALLRHILNFESNSLSQKRNQLSHEATKPQRKDES